MLGGALAFAFPGVDGVPLGASIPYAPERRYVDNGPRITLCGLHQNLLRIGSNDRYTVHLHN